MWDLAGAHVAGLRRFDEVVRKDGSGYENLRACIEGPVFNPARILWDRWMGEEQRLIATPPEGFPVVRTWPG